MNLPVTIFVVLLIALIIIGFAKGFIRNRIPFKKWFMLVANDHVMPFTEEGRAEIKRSAHHFHYYYTAATIALLMILAAAIDRFFTLDWFQVKSVGFVGCVIIGYLVGLAVNFVREWYYSEIKGKEWEFRDIRFGGYGGRDGAIVGYLLVLMLLNITQ